MRKKHEARKLVRDFFALPDMVVVCKDDDGETYMTDRYAIVHVNSPAFPAPWYINLAEGVYKLRSTGDPVRDSYFEVKDRADVLGAWEKFRRNTDWRPVEETPWTRGGSMQMLFRHDGDADRPTFASRNRIEAFRDSAKPGYRVRFDQPVRASNEAIRVTAESGNGRITDLVGYVMPIRLSGPIGRNGAVERLQKQADAILATYLQYPDPK